MVQIAGDAAPSAKKMTEGELKAILNAKVTNSLGYYGGKLAAARVEALQYYQGEPFGNEMDGRSQVVSRDVAEAIDSMMPSLMKIFTSGEETVRFEPTRPADEEIADQATDYVNWIWNTQNDGFRNTYDWFKDAMLNRTGAVKIWWDEQEEVAKERYNGLTDQEFVLLTEDTEDDELEIVEHDEYPDPMAAMDAPAPAPSAPPAAGGPPSVPPPGQLQPQMGQIAANSPIPPQGPQPPAAAPMPAAPPDPPPPPMLHDVVIRRTNKGGRIHIQPLPGEEFLMDRRAVSLSGVNATPFCAHRQKKTISDLIEMGYDYDLVKNLGEGDSSDFNPERLERFRQEDELPYRTGNNYDPSMREVWINECYINVDFDGDGIAELRKITFAGEAGNFAPGATVILDNEEIDDHPFAALTPIPMPHKFYGQSIADQTMDLQLIKSTLWRTTLDHTYNAIMPQVAVSSKVNLDDLLTRRPGGVIRVDGIPSEHFSPVPSGTLGVDPFQAIAYIDQVREQRTGVQRFTAGPGADTLNNAFTDTATGANLVENSSQERIELVARCFAELGFKPAFRKIIKLVSMHQSRAKMVRLRGKWVAMDPREWETEFDATVTVGLGTGNRQQQLQGMQLLLQADQQIITEQRGMHGPLVTAENVYAKLNKICQYLGLKSADSFYTDPANSPPQPQQPKPDPALQVAQIKAQADQQKTQAQLQADQQKFGAQAALEQHKAQTEAQIEQQKLGMQMQADHAKTLLTLQSQERVAAMKIQAEREVEYARIAAEREEFNAEKQLELMRHSTDTALQEHKMQSDEQGRAADREMAAQGQQAERATKDREHEFKVSTTPGAKPPPAPPKVSRIALVRGSDGFATQAHRHYDDGSSEVIHIDRLNDMPGAMA